MIIFLFLSGLFELNIDSGDIFTSANIDREERSSYKLDVMVSDKDPVAPKHNYTQIEINISDVNDNAPKFQHDSWNIQVTENIAINSAILQVRCHCYSILWPLGFIYASSSLQFPSKLT